MTETATRKAEEDCNNLDFFQGLTLLLRSSCIWIGYASGLPREDRMKRSIALWASLIIGFLAGSTRTASAVIGPVHLLNRASSEKWRYGAVVAVRVVVADRQNCRKAPRAFEGAITLRHKARWS